MALNAYQQNIASDMQAYAKAMLELRSKGQYIVAAYTDQSMTTLTDEEWQELAEFVHVTAAEMNAAKNAISAIDTALGTLAAGQNAFYLLRILSSLP